MKKRAIALAASLGALGASLVGVSALPAGANGTGTEGCTPGYWKNHEQNWPAPYTPDTLVKDVFTLPASIASLGDLTLLEALDGGGGDTLADKAKILLRAAVASLLNATYVDLDYPATSAAMVIRDTNNVLATERAKRYIFRAEKVDGWNNLGCPLGN